MEKQKILFLAASPLGTSELALGREARAIQEELERSQRGGDFEFVTRWAVSALDLIREVRRHRPSIVHFSGHGQRDGLLLEATDGAQLASPEAIARVFASMELRANVIVLSACYSADVAEALAKHADCVVGIDGQLEDAAARTFAIVFYGALGESATVAAAFEQACAALQLVHAGGVEPRLHVQRGVDPAGLRLTAPRARAPHAVVAAGAGALVVLSALLVLWLAGDEDRAREPQTSAAAGEPVARSPAVPPVAPEPAAASPVAPAPVIESALGAASIDAGTERLHTVVIRCVAKHDPRPTASIAVDGKPTGSQGTAEILLPPGPHKVACFGPVCTDAERILVDDDMAVKVDLHTCESRHLTPL